MRITLFIALAVVCVALVACGGRDDDPTPVPTTDITGTPPADSYLGAVLGTWRTVNGATFVTESGTGVYYSVSGVPEDAVLGQVLFVLGRIRPVPNVHLIQASYITAVPVDGGSVGCAGTLAKTRLGGYFVEGAGDGGCGSVELIEGDAAKLDPRVGEETGLTVRWCTVTKEGRMVKADLSDFECSGPPSFGPNGQIS